MSLRGSSAGIAVSSRTITRSTAGSLGVTRGRFIASAFRSSACDERSPDQAKERSVRPWQVEGLQSSGAATLGWFSGGSRRIDSVLPHPHISSSPWRIRS